MHEKHHEGAEPGTVLVIGLGILSRKLISDLCADGSAARIVVATRSIAAIEWCNVMSIVSGVEVVAETGDALDEGFLVNLLRRWQPRLVIQCASLLSPYFLAGHPLKDVVARAGFGFQLPAQLPVAFAVMRAVREAAPSTPVVNCSFPDAVNAVLHRAGLAPLMGIGNAGILHYLIEQAFRRSSYLPRIQVYAHHGHAIAVLKNQDLGDAPAPVVMVDGERVAWNTVRPRFKRALEGDEINILTAASARAALRTLCGAPDTVDTSLPGFQGMAGGIPVTLEGGTVRCAHPDSFDTDELVSLMHVWGRMDGIESISDQGVVQFTDRFRAAVEPVLPAMCEPLAPSAARARFDSMRTLIERHSSL